MANPVTAGSVEAAQSTSRSGGQVMMGGRRSSKRPFVVQVDVIPFRVVVIVIVYSAQVVEVIVADCLSAEIFNCGVGSSSDKMVHVISVPGGGLPFRLAVCCSFGQVTGFSTVMHSPGEVMVRSYEQLLVQPLRLVATSRTTAVLAVASIVKVRRFGF